MKVVREHINEKFVEDSDPLEDLGLGMKNNPKVVLPFITKRLKEYGITVKWYPDKNLYPGFYGASIELEHIEENNYDDTEKYPYIEISYATDKAAEKEGWDGGFQVAEGGGDLVLEPTHNIDEVIKAVLKLCYESKKEIKRRLQIAQKKIMQANKEIEFYQNVLKIL